MDTGQFLEQHKNTLFEFSHIADLKAYYTVWLSDTCVTVSGKITEDSELDAEEYLHTLNMTLEEINIVESLK